jgi:hypothetical protein
VSPESSLVAAWATVLVTVIAVLAGLGGVWWQLRKTSLLHSAEMVTALAERFNSETMRHSRVHFAELLESHCRGNSVWLSGDLPVLSFFEHVGHLVRRHALDEQMAWNRFSWLLARYYLALTVRGNLLADIRQKETEPELYIEFEWLCRWALQRYRRLGVWLDGDSLREAWLDQLFAQETHLGENGSGSSVPRGPA